MPLARIGDHVECRHHQAGAVADHADLAVEFDVVQIVLLGLEFQWIGGLCVLELGVIRMTEIGVAVQGDLPVQRQDLVVGRAHQGVDLHQGGVLVDEHLPELGDRHRGRVEYLRGQVALLGDRPGERHVDSLDCVHRNLGEPVRLGGGHLLDLHTALHRAHGEVGAIGAIEQEGDVILLGDIAGLGDQQLLHNVTLDIQTEDVRGVGEGVLGRGGELHTAGLTAATSLDLGFHHDRSADLLGDRFSVGGRGGHPAGCGGDVVLGEEFLRLILEKVHGISTGSLAGLWFDEDAPRELYPQAAGPRDPTSLTK